MVLGQVLLNVIRCIHEIAVQKFTEVSVFPVTVNLESCFFEQNFREPAWEVHGKAYGEYIISSVFFSLFRPHSCDGPC